MGRHSLVVKLIVVTTQDERPGAPAACPESRALPCLGRTPVR